MIALSFIAVSSPCDRLPDARRHRRIEDTEALDRVAPMREDRRCGAGAAQA